MAEDASRISVSRDALRADLAEMELRLRIFLEDQLRQKADAATVAENSRLLLAFGRGEFTPAQQASIRVLAAAQTTADQDKGWTRKQRIGGLIAITVTVLSFLTSVSLGLTTLLRESAPAAPAVTTTEVP